MVNFLDEIGKFIFSTKYAKYNENENRREIWTETVQRVQDMHLKKYSKLEEEDKQKIKDAFDLVRSKKVVPSMRSMQFGGKAVFAHEARLYNCAVRHIDSIRSFAESFYALLCGVGVDFGLSEKFMSRLPDLVTKDDKNGSVITYTVEDTIEGWADSVEAMLMCFFKNTSLSGRKIVFDYSKIRPRGTPLKTGGGLAPGHEGLKRAHKLIKKRLDYIIESFKQKRMKTIDAYDILMYCSDAVLSGGIRRAACSVTFQKDDDDMMESKTNKKIQKYRNFERIADDKNLGFVWYNDVRFEVTLTDYEFELLKKRQISWVHVEPQRARSNNSVLLLRNEMTKKEVHNIVNKAKEWGEPGFVFANHEDTLFNPCLTGDTLLKVNINGYIQQKSINVMVDLYNSGVPFEILSFNEKTGENEFKKVSKAWLTKQNAKLIKITDEDSGLFIKCTPDHQIFTLNRGWVEAQYLKETDELNIF